MPIGGFIMGKEIDLRDFSKSRLSEPRKKNLLQNATNIANEKVQKFKN